MNLLALRTEVQAHGFEQTVWATRINTYLNDAQNLIARRVNYYVDEATQAIATISGTFLYAWPADLGRIRDLFDANRGITLLASTVRTMDNSSSTLTGAPVWYATQGAATRLYPIPDGAYNLTLRYWKMPPALVNDQDIPNLPADYHQLLWTYAVAQCYKGDDDMGTGSQWMQDFNTGLSMFSADVKFPSTDSAHQVKGMWDSDDSLDAAWPYFANR